MGCRTSKPILWFYNKINHTFGTENYLIGVKNDKFRTALAKLRPSSHTLAIESGRHSRPKVNVHECLCHACQCVEDEVHFMLDRRINSDEWAHFFTKMTRAYPDFESLSNIKKYDFVLSNQDNQLMTWTGKFIYKSFARRSGILNGLKSFYYIWFHMVLPNVMLFVVGLWISILLQGSTPSLISSKPYTMIIMLVPTVTITLHACVCCYRFVCSYMYMNAILHVILYQVSFLYCFHCTYVLPSQKWLNKNVHSVAMT